MQTTLMVKFEANLYQVSSWRESKPLKFTEQFVFSLSFPNQKSAPTLDPRSANRKRRLSPEILFGRSGQEFRSVPSWPSSETHGAVRWVAPALHQIWVGFLKFTSGPLRDWCWFVLARFLEGKSSFRYVNHVTMFVSSGTKHGAKQLILKWERPGRFKSKGKMCYRYISARKRYVETEQIYVLLLP